MQDDQIVELYWRREESAIAESSGKYGAYCFSVAENILQSPEDSEECVNDTWLRAWNAMPPQRPARLRMFFAKITRHLAFDKFKARTAQKRGCGELHLVLSELEECISSPDTPETLVAAKELEQSIGRFVRSLPEREAMLFARRYFFGEAVSKIARNYGLTSNNTTVILSRIRNKLKTHLEKEGYIP